VSADKVGKGEQRTEVSGMEESERWALAAARWLRGKRFWKATMSLMSWVRVAVSREE
jgi:hypothetical protein